MGDVLAMALAGKRQEAEKAMERGSRFAEVSSELTQAMLEWKASITGGGRS